MELENLGKGYSPNSGNTPADNIFNKVLPNAVTAKSDQLFALARKSSLWTLSFGLACCAIEMMSTHMSHHDLDRLAFSQTSRRYDCSWNSSKKNGRAYKIIIRTNA